MKLSKILSAVVISLTLIACGTAENSTTAVPPELTTSRVIDEVDSTQVAAPSPERTLDEQPVPIEDVTCNVQTFIPCANPVPICKAGDVLIQGVCTLSICNTATHIPCAVAPPVCREDEILVMGICTDSSRVVIAKPEPVFER